MCFIWLEGLRWPDCITGYRCETALNSSLICICIVCLLVKIREAVRDNYYDCDNVTMQCHIVTTIQTIRQIKYTFSSDNLTDVGSNLHTKTTLFCIEIFFYRQSNQICSLWCSGLWCSTYTNILRILSNASICLINTWTFAGFVIFHVIKNMIHPGKKHI